MRHGVRIRVSAGVSVRPRAKREADKRSQKLRCARIDAFTVGCKRRTAVASKSGLFRPRCPLPCDTPPAARLVTMRSGPRARPGFPKRTALVFVCLFVRVTAQPQSVSSTVTSPTPSLCSGDVDASTTPDAAGCVSIAGSLRVSGELHPAFTDVYQALNSDGTETGRLPTALTEIKGDLVVAPEVRGFPTHRVPPS